MFVLGIGSCYYRSIGTVADYNTGTVNVVQGSTTVTGTGTAWLASNRGRGDRIFINGVNYVIAAVSSDTQLLLRTAYAGASASYSSPIHLIARQFTTLQAWEDCVDGPPGTACPFFPVAKEPAQVDPPVPGRHGVWSLSGSEEC